MGGGRRYRVCSALCFAFKVHLNSDVLHLQLWPHVARDSSVLSQLGLSGDSLASLIQRTLVSGDICEYHDRGVGSSWHPVGGARDAVSPSLCPQGALQKVTRPGIRSRGRKLVWAHAPPGIRWCRRAPSCSSGGQTGSSLSGAALPDSTRCPVSRVGDTVAGRFQNLLEGGESGEGCSAGPGLRGLCEQETSGPGRRNFVESGLTEFNSEEAATGFPRKRGEGGVGWAEWE